MLFVATWVDLEIIMLGKVSKTKTNIIWCHSHVESNFLNDANEIIYKAETDVQIWKTNMVTKG